VIRLTRDRTQQAIPASFRGQKRVATELALLKLRRAGTPPSPAVWKRAKDQLKRESDGKCGYCEGKASHVAHGDVEHFRPKTIYWWLAYCYDNYVFACQICNQSFKGSNFPLSGPPLAGPAVVAGSTDAELDALAGTLGPDPLDAQAVQQFQAQLGAELAGLPDPYLVDPEPLFAWRADDALREVEIQPRDASQDAQQAFDAAERFLGLNRDELKRWRYETYEIVVLFVSLLKSGQLDATNTRRTEDQLRRMMGVTGEFAALVRYYVRDVEGLAL
jgi:hypothetical protein